MQLVLKQLTILTLGSKCELISNEVPCVTISTRQRQALKIPGTACAMADEITGHSRDWPAASPLAEIVKSLAISI